VKFRSPTGDTSRDSSGSAFSFEITSGFGANFALL
jgi:hypothetical protein